MALKVLNVAVRCRPVLPHDRDQRTCITVSPEGREIRCLDPEHLHNELRAVNGRPDYLKEGHCRERSYVFDQVFGMSSMNDQLFESLVAPLVPEVLRGKNATCFAYGQTGSGKTHTMLGRQGETGLVERTLISLLGSATRDTKVSVTFVEVYNERIRDLLCPSCPVLDLREDPLRGPCMVGVREVASTTADSVMELVRTGNQRRTEERTAANPVSSRSHAVLQLCVETPLVGGKGGARRSRVARLSLIDLAGSERAGNTENRGARLREGAMINRSLLALANCITALTRKGSYVNYRDSKLTRLLKDSLSGKAHTVMVVHVSPSIASFEETLNTLKYAHRACEIRGMCGGVRENVCVVPKHYGEQMQDCVDAVHTLRVTMARLTVPGARAGTVRQPHGAAPHHAAPATPSPLSGVAGASHAVALADAIEQSRRAVVAGMKKRVSVEQCKLELDDQDEANAIELAKLELNAICGSAEDKFSAPPVRGTHDALRAASRRNGAERKRLRQAASKAERDSKDGRREKRLVALLAEAKSALADEHGAVSDVEKRLLSAQQANALLEVEKVEAEQAHVLLEAESRRSELALRKQALQLDVHVRALAAAEALIAERGLGHLWLEALGPLAKLLPPGDRPAAPSPAPSVDELIAELNAPEPPSRSPSPSSESPAPAAAAVDGELRAIEEGFAGLRATLRCSAKQAPTGLREVEAEDDPDTDVPDEGYVDDFDDDSETCSGSDASRDASPDASSPSRSVGSGGTGSEAEPGGDSAGGGRSLQSARSSDLGERRPTHSSRSSRSSR